MDSILSTIPLPHVMLCHNPFVLLDRSTSAEESLRTGRHAAGFFASGVSSHKHWRCMVPKTSGVLIQIKLK